MKSSPIHSKTALCRWSLAALVLAVQACGGGGSEGAPTAESSGSSPATAVPAAPAPVAATPTPAPASGNGIVLSGIGQGPSPAPAPAPAPVAAAPAPVPAPAPAAPAPTPAPTPAPATTPSGSTLVQLSAATTCSIPGMKEAILAQINATRAAGRVCGTSILPPAPAMAWNDLLFSAAAKHSQDMATRNYFSHDSLDGTTFAQRLTNEGYRWSTAAENIAAGMGTVSGVMTTWLNSDGHCRNIMEPTLNEVAVACVVQGNSTYGTYWTMDLGRR